MSHSNVETAAVPGMKYPMTAPWYGCARSPRCPWCWYFGGVKDRIAEVSTCPECKAGDGRPHLHLTALHSLPKTGGHVYSGHMGEIADLTDTEIRYIQGIIEDHPNDIFQLFTHRPMEFYTKYPDWPDNVWAMGTFTEGLIQFPPNLKAGKIVAYCEPVMGPLVIPRGIDWLVIGLLNHRKEHYTMEELKHWVMVLIGSAQHHCTPIFCKNTTDPRWKAMNIQPIQEWPR